MKKNHTPYLLLMVLAICVVVLGFRFKNLENEFRVYKSSVSSQLNNLRNEISLIYHNVDNRMKKEASLFTKAEYVLGELNPDHTVDVAFTLIPKTLTDDMQITISFEGNDIAFERNGDVFKCNMNVGMFLEHTSSPLVTIITSSNKQTEYLENVHLSYLYKNYLPQISAESGGGSTYFHTSNELRIDHSFTLNINSAPNNKIEFKKITLIEEINGKELSRKDITDEVMSSDGFYHSDYSKTYKFSVGDKFVIYVEAEDSLGYIHRETAYYWYENDSGAVADLFYSGEAILDKNGNVLVDNEFIA